MKFHDRWTKLTGALLLTLPLVATADKMPSRPMPVFGTRICMPPAMYPQCGVLGSPCCLAKNFYFDPKEHPLPEALKILQRVADRDPDEASTQLKRLRDAGRIRDAAELRAYPKLAALYAKL